MKAAIEEVKSVIKEKVQSWNKINNGWIKLSLILLFLALIALKVFTTVFTFEWLSNLF